MAKRKFPDHGTLLLTTKNEMGFPKLHTMLKRSGRSVLPGKPDSPDSEKRSRFRSDSHIQKAWSLLQHPMLTRSAASVNDDPDWIYEPKYDGYRAITMVRHGNAEMVSRNGKSFNQRYKPLIHELETIADEVILDGEIVIEEKRGLSNFQLLQNYLTTGKGILRYYVFDILYLNGHDTTEFPLHQRKELLKAFYGNYNFSHIYLAPFVKAKGNALLKKLSGKGYEGIIAKDAAGIYMPGQRSGAWLKVKSTMMQEAVICGYTLPQKSRKYFGSLLLGLYEKGKLKYIGNCGTGFTETSLEELHTTFNSLETLQCPFDEHPVLQGAKGKVIWLKPRLVCNVKFHEWTKDLRMRIPVFMGLRDDKKAAEVVREIPV